MSTNTILHARSKVHHWSGTGALSIKSFTGGCAYYEVGTGRYLVDDGCYLILNHDQEYTVAVDSPTVMESFCVFFAPGFAEEIQYSTSTRTPDLLDSPALPSASPKYFFERIYPHDDLLSPALLQMRTGYPLRKHEPGWVEEQLHLIMTRLLTVQGHVGQEVNTLPALRPATREELYRRLYRAYDFIAASYDQPLQLEDMAQAACLSPNHFLRTFKQLFHQTPHQHLTEQRLQQAQHLLLTTDQPVTDICFAVGFESLGSFSWLFRRHYGNSPAQFRCAKR